MSIETESLRRYILSLTEGRATLSFLHHPIAVVFNCFDVVLTGQHKPSADRYQSNKPPCPSGALFPMSLAHKSP